MPARYEPYVVLRTCDAPLYDERFFGYGKNKIQVRVCSHPFLAKAARKSGDGGRTKIGSTGRVAARGAVGLLLRVQT